MFEKNINEPKYKIIKSYIKNLIKEKIVKNGQMLPSEYELTEKFDVSRHTVRQAFGELAKEGWIYKEQGKGTFARYVNTSDKKGMIGLITTYISDYIFPHIINGIESIMTDEGYSLIIANTNNNKEKEAYQIKSLMEQNIKGLIIEPTKSAEENVNLYLLKEALARDIKIMFINATYKELESEKPNVGYIIMDDVKGGYIATHYLLETGHRRIAGIFKQDDIQGVRREEGYRKALESFNIIPYENLIGHFTTEEKNSFPHKFVQGLLHKELKPDAIVCYNDEIALKVIQTAKECGLSVPQDISVIGYDDSKLATVSDVNLTTVKHPKKEMGEQAAYHLIKMLENDCQKHMVIYEPELAIRSSCKERHE